MSLQSAAGRLADFMSRLEGNDLTLRCREVHDTARKAIDEDVLSVLKKVAKDARSYTFKERMKDSKSIQKKVSRKRAEGAKMRAAHEAELARMSAAGVANDAIEAKDRERLQSLLEQAEKSENYGPDHVTDGWGCRYVSLYQSEIPPIVEALLQRLEEFNGKSTSGTIRMRECVIYTNRPPGDPLSIVDATMEVVRRSDLARSVIAEGSNVKDPENRKSAYSSVHFVFERDVTIEHAGKDEEEEIAYFEIQIRDIFEEGWGEVQHHLLYSEKDNLEADDSGDDAERQTWRLHLNALKTFVDGCSQHASIIKRNLEMLEKRRIESIESESLAKRNDDEIAITRLLKSVGRRRETQKLVSLAYTFLMAAESAQRPEEAAENYEKALSEFRSLTQSAASLLDSRIGTGSPTLRYVLDTEMAFCTAQLADTKFKDRATLTGQEEAELGQLRRSARDLYQGIVDAYPDDAAARFGLAKALMRTNGQAALGQADQLLDECLERIRNDDLERHRLLPVSARLQKGVVLGRQSDVAGLDAATVRQRLEGAVDFSCQAYDAWAQQSEDKRRASYNRLNGHKAASNVLYYAAQLVKRGWTREGYDDELLRKYISILESFSVAAYSEYYKTRDNIMQARSALKEHKIEKDLALETFNELRAEAERRAGSPLDIAGVKAHLRGAELACYNSAVEVLFPSATSGRAATL